MFFFLIFGPLIFLIIFLFHYSSIFEWLENGIHGLYIYIYLYRVITITNKRIV